MNERDLIRAMSAPTIRRRPNDSQRMCPKCGCTFYAPPSRIAWVFGMHLDKCTRSTPEQRQIFSRTRRWPK